MSNMTEAFQKGDPARVASRYRSERRFRMYGLLAVIITALFLAFLVVDLVSKGLPAFIEHHAIVEVNVDPAKVDPANIRAGDFNGLAKEAFRNDFPEVKSRADRKTLGGLMSTGAGDDLRNLVLANPGLIGKTITVPLLFSDDADLYLKGTQTAVTKTPGQGALAIVQDGDNIHITTAGPLVAGTIVRANDGAFRIAETGNGTARAEVIVEPSAFGDVTGNWDVMTFSRPEADRRINDEGVLVLKVQQHRSQEQNREEALQKLVQMIQAVLVEPKPRRATKPSAAARRKRLEQKTQRSTVKSLRRPPASDQ